MNDKKIKTEDIADALINLSAELGLCDSGTTKGLKTSNKKNILKSSKENSFSKFTCEIVKCKNRKH